MLGPGPALATAMAALPTVGQGCLPTHHPRKTRFLQARKHEVDSRGEDSCGRSLLRPANSLVRKTKQGRFFLSCLLLR